MPNGGHISCVDCTYSRSQNGICDIFGIETSGKRTTKLDDGGEYWNRKNGYH